jgi:hypothetical protein
MLRKPELSLPDMMESSAELEGVYRLLRNPRLSLGKVTQAHSEATACRCGALAEVLVVHDTTEFAFARRDDYERKHLCSFSKGRQGFYAHVSLAVSADGLRAPLGVLRCWPYVHAKHVDSETKAFWDEGFGEYENEGDRWVAALRATDEHLKGHCSGVIHVCDREADTNDVLQYFVASNSRFVIRAFQGRKTVGGESVHEVAGRGAIVAERTITLSERSLTGLPKTRKAHPERKRREAHVVIRSCSVILRSKVGLRFPINVVDISEPNPPSDEEPIHWVLLTREPSETLEQILKVVDIYRSRWLIEEYFKAIKTGCGYEHRQLDSAATLLVALGITLVIAWQLLGLVHLSRHADKLPATAVLNDLQVSILRAATPKLRWPRNPTVGDAARGIARLGGHISWNGSPGWQVLGRGLHKLFALERGARIAMSAGLVIND